MAFEEKYTSCYILLTDQILLSTLSNFIFLHYQKRQNKNLNILRTRIISKVKQKPFFIIFKWPSVATNCLRRGSGSLKKAMMKRFILRKRHRNEKKPQNYCSRLYKNEHK